MMPLSVRFLALLVCSLAQPATAQDTVAIDRILAAYEGDNPGAALLVIQDGAVLLQRCYGYADLEHQKKVTPATNFRLASVSKQFTAAAILQLINAGKLGLSTTLSEAFADFPTYGDVVTVKHLLTHTSGIPDYEDFVADTSFNPQIKDQGVLDILMKLDSGYFTPGHQYRYSNSAYALLALLVEKYSGQPFAAYLQAHIFKPLGMTTTLAHEAGKSTVSMRAFGYTKTNNHWELRDQSATSAVLGDGGIYSNVLDLFKWDQSLYSDGILPDHLVKQAFAYNTLTSGDTVKYGYGWHLRQNESGDKVVYHTGSSTSFRNIFYRVPARRFSIILLTNRDQPVEEDMLILAERIAKAISE
ncbi:serine hydrolase domain-containing protein [Parapedobacter pyrenivorans]|uniref:serine hydrolase domain-containing protein n=1 Tax=Parapedobacter pyrenivorans TaxID=1305674 RepID=UPI00333FE80B